ncbi:RNA polymerase sigma-70 factor (ECF subfamily) [Chitinophaga niastensis]|uniref:RNA polymerase sigma-70 factor (ECF subfamily) n=1 Tax=Chitinophaga niastensis TaxID=536980 RepID=A0A2P8HDU6_CHINA|nr:sigma-70 family RNA polymerase sigma factor [Chitinophaga niastensis]PSL44311.1 RNA polymerase sigma-70 factor (ECF subfamily) [Chitinophaga niastensis]
MFDEKQVVSRILIGDFRAFESLVKQYEHLVFFVINRLVREKEDQEDICQEVFIKVHHSLPRFAFASRLSTWIARIAYLTAINHIKKNNKHRNTDYPADLDQFHFTSENPEGLLTRKDLGQYLEELISQMPEKYRITITLYHLNEFSCAEIESITGIPETTIKTYLFRGRKLLKQKIEHHFKNQQL